MPFDKRDIHHVLKLLIIRPKENGPVLLNLVQKAPVQVDVRENSSHLEQPGLCKTGGRGRHGQKSITNAADCTTCPSGSNSYVDSFYVQFLRLLSPKNTLRRSVFTYGDFWPPTILAASFRWLLLGPMAVLTGE